MIVLSSVLVFAVIVCSRKLTLALSFVLVVIKGNYALVAIYMSLCCYSIYYYT